MGWDQLGMNMSIVLFDEANVVRVTPPLQLYILHMIIQPL